MYCVNCKQFSGTLYAKIRSILSSSIPTNSFSLVLFSSTAMTCVSLASAAMYILCPPFSDKQDELDEPDELGELDELDELDEP